MSRTVRMLMGLVLIFALCAVVVDRRARRLREGFQVRVLLDRQASLRNEIAYLQGEILSLSRIPLLKERAASLGVTVGEPFGAQVVAPAPTEWTGH